VDCLRQGAVRVSSTSITGKQITLTYVEPGIWFGDVAIFDGDRRTHDAYAHGATTLLCVAKAISSAFWPRMWSSTKPCCGCRRGAFASCTAWWRTSTPCPARRLAKQLLHLARSYGIPSLSDSQEIRIGLQLAQEELAQLLGASRQRVNQELKGMEREGSIRIEPGGLVVRDRNALLRIAETDL
jgi:CRP-like cAMP-binding protein